MAKVIITIAAEDGMCFENVMSFKTENYIGIWDNVREQFMLIRKCNDNRYFEPYCLEEDIDELAELDEVVYDLVDEHITEVFDHSDYTIELN